MMMKVRVKTIAFFLMFVVPCFAQQDTIKINIRDVDITMVKVEGGTYQRGCNETIEEDSSCFKQIRGENTVTVNTFYMAQLEVTQELYHVVTGKWPAWFKPDKALGLSKQCPVESVSWYQAQGFIDTLNALTGKKFRLPTEAEWEYAARGGKHNDPYRYAGSDNIDEVTWFHHDDPNILNVCHAWTMPSGKKKPNSLGLYDMTGNVAEWCSDWYSETYYQTRRVFNNPKGPETGEKKAVRGNSFGVGFLPSMDIRHRRGVAPDKKDMHIGFRLVMDAE